MTAFEATATTPADAVTASDTDAFIAKVKEYADNVLRPGALRTDREGVTSEQISQFARLGLLNHAAPAEFGGAGIGRAGDRRLHEIIAGACFNTWLVWAQHAPTVGRLALSWQKDATLSGLARDALAGRVLLGAAISDVRRFPHSFITATRTRAGWTFSGTISWVSGWGLNTVLAVAAVEPATETVVTAFVPISDRVTATYLNLAAVGGSRTARVTLHQVFVSDSDVLLTQTLNDWHTEDLSTAGDTRPQYFGLATRVVDELDEADHPGARRVAAVWRPRIQGLRADAYGLADEAKATGDERHRIAERVATKAAVGEALAVITRALVVARSGRSITLEDTAQLHARSALFLLVQGQSADVRDAQLSSLAR
ncbi:acyl-CoA dehydrogenase family protein [Mycolicibacterium goodii]|uniref:Acyl-CoA/acyl-ACP dehydrogenase n=1 Tax=Mycolicibacterium goodii TaxID=134601 RepID=A0ABS6HRC1_MYCGD|nr:acyl-CoA dehydrogenase family protein [Mycolicibacterium goodii]MBU8816726.1 acyl-CoA/acyl-ACP dehydrogenase [Mycolicibacterium goodii]MBU8823868.1 acyl-CoA/acyl-ACP dehydrogenase [Mycolicibacterium goodii]MBU8836513.1 acyl-CoA/acyl-ACP dehydrogenase [Mycolicibacterium goodii]